MLSIKMKNLLPVKIALVVGLLASLVTSCTQNEPDLQIPKAPQKINLDKAARIWNENYGQKAADLAKQFIGRNRYVYGATPRYQVMTAGNDYSMDCSSFVASLYYTITRTNFGGIQTEGYQIGESTNDQPSKKCFINVAYDRYNMYNTDLRAGDLIYFDLTGSGIGHTGIYIGNYQTADMLSPSDPRCKTVGLLGRWSNVRKIVRLKDLNVLRNFVERFYEKCLNRESDPEGLRTWTRVLLFNEHCAGHVANGFINSEEFKRRNVSNSDYLYILYRAFFDREPDAGGYQNWMNALNSGKSRQYVLDGFIDSVEFANFCGRYQICAR